MTRLRAVTRQYYDGWLEDLDGRTNIAQDMRHRYQALTDDLGGDLSLSYQQRSLVKRALWLEFWLQFQENQLAHNGDMDIGKWVQAVNSLQGILAKLGLHRQAKDLPDFATYLKQGKDSQ